MLIRKNVLNEISKEGTFTQLRESVARPTLWVST